MSIATTQSLSAPIPRAGPPTFGRVLISGCRFWCWGRDGDPALRAIQLRHYSARPNRNLPRNTNKFVGLGEYVALTTPWEDALFIWRKRIGEANGQWAWDGVCCSVFRNESPHLSSEMILEAERVAWTRWPGERLYTFVDAKKVRSANPGYCFRCAGWQPWPVDTKRGLIGLQKFPQDVPAVRTSAVLDFSSGAVHRWVTAQHWRKRQRREFMDRWRGRAA